MLQKWKRLHRRTILNTPFMKVHCDRVVLPNGRQIDDYSVVSLQSGVIVVATDAMGRLITMQEYKYAIDKVILNLPSGGIENGQSPLEAAARELAEETGYSSNEWEYIQLLHEYPSKADHEVHVIRAFNAHNTTKVSHEASETIGAVELLEVPELRQLIQGGEIETMYVIAALALTMPEVLSK